MNVHMPSKGQQNVQRSTNCLRTDETFLVPTKTDEVFKSLSNVKGPTKLMRADEIFRVDKVFKNLKVHPMF